MKSLSKAALFPYMSRHGALCHKCWNGSLLRNQRVPLQKGFSQFRPNCGVESPEILAGSLPDMETLIWESVSLWMHSSSIQSLKKAIRVPFVNLLSFSSRVIFFWTVYDVHCKLFSLFSLHFCKSLNIPPEVCVMEVCQVTCEVSAFSACRRLCEVYRTMLTAVSPCRSVCFRYGDRHAPASVRVSFNWQAFCVWALQWQRGKYHTETCRVMCSSC